MAYTEYQQRRIDGGLCKDCGTKRGNAGTKVFCRPCADKQSKLAAKRVERKRSIFKKSSGCNQCGADKEQDNRSLCNACQKRARESYKRHQAIRTKEHPKKGLCVKCSRKVIGLSRYCKKHWLGDSFSRKHGVSPNVLYMKLEAQNFKCFYTSIELVPGKNASLDHLNPQSRYPDEISNIDNIVWCDKRINLMKGNYTYEEFLAACNKVIKISETGQALLASGATGTGLGSNELN